MPRHNENARSREQTANGRWRAAELKAMSEHVEKLQDLNLKYFQKPTNFRSRSTIKTTGESIVREHRNSVADLIRTPSIQRVYKAPWYKAIHPVEYKNFKFLGSIGRLKGMRRPGLIHTLLYGVNWTTVLNWACWGALIGCLIYLGIFVFGPFAVKITWK